MTRQQKIDKIEKKGYSVKISMSGNCVFGEKNNGLEVIKASSISQLHQKIFGY